MTGVALPVAVALAWIGGIALQLQQRSLSAAAIYLGLIGSGAVLAGAAWRWRARRGPTLVLAVVATALLAFGQTGLRALDRLAGTLPAQLEGRDLHVVGVVAAMPTIGSAGVRFRFEVEDAREPDGSAVTVPPLIALGWYHDADAPAPNLRAGDRWRLTVRLRQPHGSLNPHGFDYELWLFEQGVRATGYVRAAHAAERIGAGVGHPIERWRQRVRDAIFAHVAERTIAGVLAALVVGDQAAIERDEWEVFRVTGVAHLMSISGLHVTMFAWLAALLVGAVWRRNPRWTLWRPAQTAGLWGGLAAAAAYAVFSGWGVPAQRTVFMLASVVALRSAGVRWPWALVLLAAAFVVSAIDPWALLQAGFWLSFAAVGLLLASAPAQHRSADAVGWRARSLAAGVALLRTQAVATVGLTPLTLVFFQQVSVLSFVANLVAIPLVTLVITPLALAGALVAPLWSVAAAITEPLVAALALLAGAPLALWSAGVAPLWAQAAGLAGGALSVAPLPWRVRWLALPLVVPLLWPAIERPPDGVFDTTVADVGQGTAVLVRTRRHLLVYDAGPQYSRDSDAGQRVLLPLLRARGEARIDTLVLSHRDTDHVGGAKALQRAWAARELLHSLPADHELLALAPAARRCEAGQRWTWDDVQFEVLHPDPGQPPAASKPNAVSCVIRVQGNAGSLLLSADIEAAQEQALVARLGPKLASDVLVVPHHGSRTSSTAAFLDAVRPRWAVIQAGYRNRFGHPAAAVVERYEARAIRVLRSDRCGAWTWRQGAGTMTCERESARRYWHHRPGAAQGAIDD